MNEEELLEQIARANWHKGGLKTLRLFAIDGNFFTRLSQEVQALVEERLPSDVGDPAHRTHWTMPFGRAVQYSLLNKSGDFNDTSVDHDGVITGKRFHHAATYPTIAEFITGFPHAYNMRLNGLDPGSGLSPHEEHVTWRSGNEYLFRARFHLPVTTNADSEMLLDEDFFHFAEGYIYYFNNGCIHSATNSGTTVRYHLVWDMRLTQETFDLMFSESARDRPDFLQRITGDDRFVVPLRSEPVKEFAVEGYAAALHRKLRLDRIGVKAYRLKQASNALNYMRYRTLGRARLADVR